MVALNPNGLVIVGDGEAPRIFTAAVRSDVLPGDFVFVSGALNTVSSGADSYTSNDVTVMPCINQHQFNGVALGSVTSGTNQYVGVLTRGYVISRVIGSLIGGTLVEFVSGTIPGVRSLTSGVVADIAVGSIAPPGKIIGRAWSDATSGTNNYGLVHVSI